MKSNLENELRKLKLYTVLYAILSILFLIVYLFQFVPENAILLFQFIISLPIYYAYTVFIWKKTSLSKSEKKSEIIMIWCCGLFAMLMFLQFTDFDPK